MHADVVELVDTLALGASASGREGSSPFIRTKANAQVLHLGFCLETRVTIALGIYSGRQDNILPIVNPAQP